MTIVSINLTEFSVFMLFVAFILAFIFSIYKANRHWVYLKHTESAYSNYKDFTEWRNKNFGKTEAIGNFIIMFVPILVKSKMEGNDSNIKQLGNNVRRIILFQYLAILLFILSFLFATIFSQLF